MDRTLASARASAYAFALTRTDALASELGIILRRLTDSTDEYIEEVKKCL